MGARQNGAFVEFGALVQFGEAEHPLATIILLHHRPLDVGGEPELEQVGQASPLDPANDRLIADSGVAAQERRPAFTADPSFHAQKLEKNTVSSQAGNQDSWPTDSTISLRMASRQMLDFG
ncbi:MAG: hypothetical protein H7840_15035 [Alphaproteobacteria bacterium]